VRRASAATAVSGTAAIVGIDGVERMSMPWTLSPSGAANIDLTLPLAGIAAGPYRLVVKASDGTHQTTREVAIRVEPADRVRVVSVANSAARSCHSVLAAGCCPLTRILGGGQDGALRRTGGGARSVGEPKTELLTPSREATEPLRVGEAAEEEQPYEDSACSSHYDSLGRFPVRCWPMGAEGCAGQWRGGQCQSHRTSYYWREHRFPADPQRPSEL
jgi:hypothetical protein